MITSADWRRLASAAFVQPFVALGVRVMSLRRCRDLLIRARPLLRPLLGGPPDRVVWAIEAAGRRLGRWSTCLTRALIAEAALGADTAPTTFTIGVRRTPDGLDAHAWIDSRDGVVIGSASEEYVPIITWPTPN